MLYLAILPVGQSHERMPEGKSREEASGGDDEDEGIDEGQS